MAVRCLPDGVGLESGVQEQRPKESKHKRKRSAGDKGGEKIIVVSDSAGERSEKTLRLQATVSMITQLKGLGENLQAPQHSRIDELLTLTLDAMSADVRDILQDSAPLSSASGLLED